MYRSPFPLTAFLYQIQLVSVKASLIYKSTELVFIIIIFFCTEAEVFHEVETALGFGKSYIYYQ